MNSNDNIKNSKSTKDDKFNNSRNNNLKNDNDNNNDRVSENDLDIEGELDPEQSEASRYNEEEYLNSKRINKHDQPVEQRELTEEEKASLTDNDDQNKNRIVN